MSTDSHVQEMMTKYNKSLSQLLLCFDLQLGVVPLTKSVHKDRIKENFDIVISTHRKWDIIRNFSPLTSCVLKRRIAKYGTTSNPLK